MSYVGAPYNFVPYETVLASYRNGTPQYGKQ